jgi:hypothetical protein
VIIRSVPVVDRSGVVTNPGVHPVLAALSRGVPLTLLLDLADPAGPDSRTIHATETADLSWLAGLAYPAGGTGSTRRTGSPGSTAVSGRAAG